MTFSHQIEKTGGEPVIHNGEEVILSHLVKVAKQFSGKITIISTNSETEQYVQVQGNKLQSLVINGVEGGWFTLDGDPDAKPYVFSGIAKKGGYLAFYNAWRDDSRPAPFNFSTEFGNVGIKKKVEGNTVTYYCNDYEMDEDFDELIYKVEFDEGSVIEM